MVNYLVHTPVKLHKETRMLTDTEIINIIDHLYIGGNETTTFALTSGLWMLIENPDIQRHLADNPHKITTFVEEVLRLESPTQGMDRHTIADVELNGIAIPKGSHIHMRYAAANRDANQFECPADIDLDRKAINVRMVFCQSLKIRITFSFFMEECFLSKTKEGFETLFEHTNNIFAHSLLCLRSRDCRTFAESIEFRPSLIIFFM